MNKGAATQNMPATTNAAAPATQAIDSASTVALGTRSVSGQC
jgi:hypothetical protein